jgi:hypothetical protein
MQVKHFQPSSFARLPETLRNSINSHFGNDMVVYVDRYLGKSRFGYWIVFSDEPICFERCVPASKRDYRGEAKIRVETQIAAIGNVGSLKLGIAPMARIWTPIVNPTTDAAKAFLSEFLAEELRKWIAKLVIVAD